MSKRIRWDIAPAGTVGAAMDAYGIWYFYTGPVEQTEDGWKGPGRAYAGHREHRPKFQAGWRESWVEIPGAVQSRVGPVIVN